MRKATLISQSLMRKGRILGLNLSCIYKQYYGKSEINLSAPVRISLPNPSSLAPLAVLRIQQVAVNFGYLYA